MIIAGGVEHMAHHPMGRVLIRNPGSLPINGGTEILNMGNTAKSCMTGCLNMAKAGHQRRADGVCFPCPGKILQALDAGYYDKLCVNMTVFSPRGGELPTVMNRPNAEPPWIASKASEVPLQWEGHVTAANASGLNDGAWCRF
jgi:acetyl-CoA acyltransferase